MHVVSENNNIQKYTDLCYMLLSSSIIILHACINNNMLTDKVAAATSLSYLFRYNFTNIKFMALVTSWHVLTATCCLEHIQVNNYTDLYIQAAGSE